MEYNQYRDSNMKYDYTYLKDSTLKLEKTNIFSFKGCIGRRTFWTISITLYIIFTIFISIINSSYKYDDENYIVELILSLVYIYLCLANNTKRLHHIGKSGWYQLSLFIPILNLYTVFLLGFKKGDLDNAKLLSKMNKVINENNIFLKILKSLSFKGRLNRKEFLYRTIFVACISIIIAISQEMFYLMSDNLFTILFLLVYILIGYALIFYVVVFSIASIIRRLQDMNKSFIYILTLFIPIWSLYTIIILFTKVGTLGENKYGIR